MATTEPTDKNRSHRIPHKYIILGTDSIGADHVLRTCDDAIFVVDGGLEARDSLAGCSWASYREYVADRRGWQEWRPHVPARIKRPFLGLEDR